nr:hypothetical protein [Tanacetum cinerariifolium]
MHSAIHVQEPTRKEYGCRHDDYLDDYFESLDKEIEDIKGEMARFTEDKNASEAPKDPTKVEEDSESLKPYQWNIGKTCVVEKGKEKQEHFRIKLEEEEDCKNQQSTHYAKEQDKNKGYTRPSTSKISDKEESYGSTSDDYFIII